MKPNTREGATCILCDIWWIILLVLVLALAIFLTRDYWMPLVGLSTPTTVPLPTLAASPAPLRTNTPGAQATPVPSKTPLPVQPSATLSANTTPSVTPNATVAPVLGAAAPNFKIPDTNGAQVELNSLRGKPVLLVFMGSNCPYCRQEAPNLEVVYKKYKDQGLQVLLVGTNAIGVPAEIKDFIQTYGLSFAPLVDDGTVFPSYQQNGVPANFFIDRNGIIRYIGSGAMDAQQIETQLAKIL
jgi:peroxiredoxin